VKVIVTAGGTSEPIDDVRSVTNFSTGRFPVAMAVVFDRTGDDVEVFASREAALRAGVRGVKHHTFTTAASLAALLDGAIGTGGDPAGPASLVVIHAAAVSDYAPVPVDGKMPSNADEITVTLRKLPKTIDSLRERTGQRAFLVGCKLTSGATVPELLAKAHELVHRARLNLVIANDLAECRGGRHPCWLVTQEGGAVRVDGNRDDVARKVAAFIKKRANVTWSATRVHRDEVRPGLKVHEAHRVLMGDLLSFANEANLLPGTDGNAVVRVGSTRSADLTGPVLLVTPRQVAKKDATPGDCIEAVVDLDGHQVHAWPPAHTPDAKPSIDTNVQARILDRFWGPQALLHTHELFGRMDAAIDFPYPCGAAEEATAVRAALHHAGVPHQRPVFSVELVHHGFLLALTAGTVARLSGEWQQVRQEYAQHLADVGAGLGDAILVPVMDKNHVVGVVAHVGDGAAVYLSESTRGTGLGAVVADQLVLRSLAVVTIDDCEVVDYWKARGFTGERSPDGSWVLEPPARQDDGLV
jgi:hypothetical protein